MPDRLIFSRIPVEDMEDFAFGGGLEWLLEQLDVDVDRELLGACTNEKPGEDEPAQTYFLERVDVDEGEREITLHGCTCPAFRYQQIPKPEHVRKGVVGLEGIGECKHLSEYRKRSREHEETDETQSSLAETLGIETDDVDGGSA